MSLDGPGSGPRSYRVPPSGGGASSKLQIAIVDDYMLMRVLVRAAVEVHLGPHAADIVEISTGKGAIEHVKRTATSLLILDLQLADMDGVEVVRQLRSAGSRVPIVMVSSVTDEARIAATLRAGAQAFVRKPFKVGELWQILEPHLRFG